MNARVLNSAMIEPCSFGLIVLLAIRGSVHPQLARTVAMWMSWLYGFVMTNGNSTFAARGTLPKSWLRWANIFSAQSWAEAVAAHSDTAQTIAIRNISHPSNESVSV